jgi:hypothetical protein
MRFLAVFLALFIGTAVAQFPDDEWLPKPIAQWPQEPDGFNGLKFGSTQAAVEKQTPLRDPQVDSRNGGTSYRTQMKAWGIDLDVSMLFLSDRLSLISVIYPAQRSSDVKAKLVDLFGKVHKTKGEDSFWYSRDVFVCLTTDGTTHSHPREIESRLRRNFFLATYEYMKDNGGEIMRAVDPPKWVPFPADHWPQEPDGFNGLKFGSTQAETEQTIKLESCENIRYGNLTCKTTLTVAGKTFSGNILFAGPYDPKTDALIGERHLTHITASIGKAEFAFVKAAFIKMYGQPHHVGDFGGGEHLTWTGNKAEIGLFVMGNARPSQFHQTGKQGGQRPWFR